MSRPTKKLKNRRPRGSNVRALESGKLPADYFRVRDFEYVQPLYDLAFLLEVGALAKGSEVPKYRTFSLWRAGYSMDGYGTTIDRWLDGCASDSDLDYVPSSRIREYLESIRKTGAIPELRSYRSQRFARCLRLRSVRGLGPSQIALTASHNSLQEEWFSQAAINLSLQRDRIVELYKGSHDGPWETAHIVPPLLRFLRSVEVAAGRASLWRIRGIEDPFKAVNAPVCASMEAPWPLVINAVEKALKREKHFRPESHQNGRGIRIKHQLGWSFAMEPDRVKTAGKMIVEFARQLDPLSEAQSIGLASDLHLHTAWSDGSASVNKMATAVVATGLQYFAVTDHSRSCKLQGGLTPALWLRQANALTLAAPLCPVLHGIEVDILKDGALDLPSSLLAAADIVVASVHSSWADDARENTDRLLRAIESGCIDIIAHPTSALIGKPGVPDYVRTAADVYWDEVFERCAKWCVALEMNCFPSRLDLSPDMLEKAVRAGCAISLGSDAHARSHLLNLRFGEAVLKRLKAPIVLNKLSHPELKDWIAESRAKRRNLRRSTPIAAQSEFQFETDAPVPRSIEARIQPPQNIPDGSRVIGIDLTAGDKSTGVAVLNDLEVETCSLISDDEILDYVREHKPKIVSIDSPLGLPGGGDSIDPKAGIVRVAEHDLASVGIPAYPALIDSMQNLTLRGIRLRRAIEQFANAPKVIESYPGAAQDILCIPRKQKSLELLREGLGRLGLTGSGLETRSHDEMDAITSAIVGRYYEAGLFEPMGVVKEAQLIVPKVRPLVFTENPVICLSGKTGAGKSVVARYLSVFYGFEWVRTRNVIRDLLIDDIAAEPGKKLFNRPVDPAAITEKDLREFGGVILDVCRQVPLRKKLTRTVQQFDVPVVVDSIRDVVDVDQKTLGSRPVLTWFVDCSDSIIRQRLEEKSKMGETRLKTASPVDHTAERIRRQADDIISNSGSLEELRWEVDDRLFARISLRR